MAHYSIKDLERLSGIQAHTIRIWEKRYHLVNPLRTDTNIRVYSDTDLKRLLNVAVLNKNGLKISKISRLTEQEINDKILKLNTEFPNIQNQIETLILAMIDLDEGKFEKLIEGLIAQYGFEVAMTSVVYPFMVKIGVLWQTGNINVAQEHFVSHIIIRKILVAIDKLGATSVNKTKTIISFLPEWESHEIGLLFLTYLVKKAGYKTIYLGQSVPVQDLISVQNSYNAGNLLVSFTIPLPDYTITEYLEILAKTFKKCKIFIFGSLVNSIDLKKNSNIFKIKSPENFDEWSVKFS